MARPDKYDANLPKNLTYRKARKSYSWRNPVDGKEISLGKISRREAIAQAIEANHYIDKNYTPIALLEQLKGTNEYTMGNCSIGTKLSCSDASWRPILTKFVPGSWRPLENTLA